MTEDQLARWKAALAARNARQRNQRGTRQPPPITTGMLRARPPLSRCTSPGCPFRWRTGPGRPCAEHAGEAVAKPGREDHR